MDGPHPWHLTLPPIPRARPEFGYHWRHGLLPNAHCLWNSLPEHLKAPNNGLF